MLAAAAPRRANGVLLPARSKVSLNPSLLCRSNVLINPGSQQMGDSVPANEGDHVNMHCASTSSE